MWRLFDWVTRRNRRTPFIDRDLFIDETDQDETETTISENNTTTMDPNSSVNEIHHNDLVIQGRKELDDFLQTDYEPRGYKDALINSDSLNNTENKEILKHQLDLKVERVLSLYESKIEDYDFHIKTRGQNGMLDTVDEIQAEKEKILKEIQKIKSLQVDAKENKGLGHMVILSYDRGFKRGLAAITASKIFGKPLSNE